MSKVYTVKVIADGQRQPLKRKTNVKIRLIAEGGEGCFYKVAGMNVGFKIYYSRLFKKERNRQYRNLKKYENTGMVPKTYYKCEIQWDDGNTFPAILMEYINGNTLDDSVHSDKFNYYFNLIKDTIEHTDLHGGNIMIGKNGKIYAIDI